MQRDPERELKEIKQALGPLEERQRKVSNELRRLLDKKKKLFGDVVLGLADAKEKAKVKQEIKSREDELEDLNLTVQELTIRKGGLERTL